MTDDTLKNASISNEETKVESTEENVATPEQQKADEVVSDVKADATDVKADVAQEDSQKEKNKKKFKLGDVAKCTLVLTVIALVAGLLLGIVNWVTYVDPDGVIADKCTAYFASETSVKDEKLASYDYDKNNYVESCFVAKNGDEIVVVFFLTTAPCYYEVVAVLKLSEIFSKRY